MHKPCLFNTHTVRANTPRPHTPASLAAAIVASVAFGTPIPKHRDRITTTRRISPEQAYQHFAYTARG